MRAALSLLLLTGCAWEYGLQAEVPQHLQPLDYQAAELTSGTADAWQVAATEGISLETITMGSAARTDVVDLLWLVDDSSSMQHVLDQVQAGFDSVVQSGTRFPDRMRMAVMHLSPAGDDGRPHPAVRARRLDPGFLAPVSRRSVSRAQYRGGRAAHFVDRTCAAWFAPTALNREGTPCLQVNTQLSLSDRRVEAGLTALEQAMTAGRLFRAGAAANVVVVSDTHDPGFSPDWGPERRQDWFDDLVERRPDFARLQAIARSTQAVASFRVHAIAPDEECSGERWIEHIGPVYFEAAEAGGGVLADICSDTDYATVITDILDSAPERQHAVVALEPLEAAEIIEVRLDDAPVDYSLPAPGVLEVQADVEQSAELEIYRRFQVQAPGLQRRKAPRRR